MCFSISISKDIDYVQRRFRAVFPDPADFEPIYHVSAFTLPSLPVISGENSEEILLYAWGLIPRWAKGVEYAEGIRRKTFNARAETMFEKPSYRASARDRRCLVLADGFYEWHEAGGRKYPYYVHLRDGAAFAIAGLWDSWTGGPGGNEVKTFSIITVEANALLAKVHNTKKRMPALLHQGDERGWLDASLAMEDIVSMVTPFEDDAMEAYPVSRLILGKGGGTNVPEARKRFDYPELRTTQATLF